MPDAEAPVACAVKARRATLATTILLGAFMTHSSTPEKPSKKNRLADSKSPYLLQHAENPVDWYPWGEEAFRAAKEQDRPIFLSIGYATCHWCHVMEHESFENAEVAALMNEAFINIKVDREERPDIDQVYMTVCQMLTGGGGWPLTIIMTPDKKPFYSGTYIPPTSMYGRIGMLDLVPKIAHLWRNDRDRAVSSAGHITDALAKTAEVSASTGGISGTAVQQAAQQLAARYDQVHGGFGAAPKFPSPHNLVFLTRFGYSSGDAQPLEMVGHTLRRMRLGGVYDQIGFGFHRYSTDARWLVPHFEKMLYDQATMLMACTEAWQAGQDPVLERTAREIVAYVVRDMTSPEGAFYSAEDADSEGEEGLFYLWSTDEIGQLLDGGDADFAAKVWSLTADGNYLDEAKRIKTGLNIPHLATTFDAAAADLDLTVSAFELRLEQIRKRLFDVREDRIHPLKDDKVLADWNGLMSAALAHAGRVFSEPSWIDAAARSVRFVDESMRRKDGRLLHRFRDGEAAIPGFLDDAVFLTTAALELYDATHEPAYLVRASELQRETLELFWDSEHGGFFFTAGDNEELLVRQKEIYDGAMPSGNSMAADNLVRLARLTGDQEFAARGEELFKAFSAQANSMPSAYGQLMIAHQRAASPSLEVVIAGKPDAEDTQALLAAVRADYRPYLSLLLIPPGEAGSPIHALAPFTQGYEMVEGKAAAYVCRDFSCQLPTTEPEELVRLLAEVDSSESSLSS
jgi:uncharacterized protein YyaL (SSP411 family)